MQVTILGSGSPPPQPSRGGQSMVVSIGDEPILVDCGPMTVEHLVEAGIELGGLSRLFFSHQHMDHNASFFHFAITSWMYGRRELTVYGPTGTESLLDALVSVYRDDLDYRQKIGRPTTGITDIDFERVEPGFSHTTATWRVSCIPVEHTIETFAYRFDGPNGSCVYSADTAHPEPVIELAKGADILVQNCGLGPAGSSGTAGDEESWRQYLATNPPPADSPVSDQHCTPEQAARAGASAGVDTLVLTHLLPARNIEAITDRVARTFEGDLYVASTGLTIGTN